MWRHLACDGGREIVAVVAVLVAPPERQAAVQGAHEKLEDDDEGDLDV